MVSVIQRIKERQVGPVGEEGYELRPAELAALPARAALGSIATDAVLKGTEEIVTISDATDEQK